MTAALYGIVSSAFTLAADAAPSDLAGNTKHILLLHQAGESGPFRGKFDVAFEETLRSIGGVPIEVYEEALDPARFPGPDQRASVREYLKNRYGDQSIDVIVAQGTAPLTFARENRGLFGNPPIVATVAPQGEMGRPNENMTGLREEFWVTETIDLALALLPDARLMVVVDGARQNSPQRQAEIERQARLRDERLSMVYLRDLPLSEVSSRIAALPPQAFVLFVKQSMLDRETDIDQFAALARVTAVSPVPVFSQLDQFLGHGIVGGYMWQFEDDARRLAEMAGRIVTGTRADDIVPGRATYSAVLDWRELQRWRIPDSRVPPGSAVLFRPRSYFDLKRPYVIGTIVILGAQFALIMSLLVQRVQRRRAEEESRRGKERYRSVVDTQTELICRFLPDTTLTFVNDAYCRFCNKTRDNLLGTKFIELIPESARPDVLGRLQRLAFGIDSHEHPVTLADGSIGWHHWLNHAILDSRGRVVELQGVGRDITEQRRAQEALGQAEARNRAMLRAIPDLMFVLTPDGTYVDYHARDDKLLFVPPEKFLGKTVRDVMPSALADVVMDAIERVCLRDETVIVEYDLPLKDTRYFEARMVRADGDRILSMVRDVTDSKRAMALNRDLAGRLIASQEVERQRIARELHDDVSQKVALLNIGIEEFARQVAPGESRNRLQQLSERTTEIARDLRDLSHELHPSRLQSLGLVAAVEILCRDTSKQIGVSVPFTHASLPRDVDPNVSLCLYRIAQEGLTNIARHSRAHHAQVQLGYEDRAVTLQIADSGIGFDDRDTPNSGLGLISMRERVAFLKGQIVIHTVRGGGTRIGVRIPVGLPAESSSPVSRTA